MLLSYSAFYHGNDDGMVRTDGRRQNRVRPTFLQAVPIQAKVLQTLVGLERSRQQKRAIVVNAVTRKIEVN